MTDTRTVVLTVTLPNELAAEFQEAVEEDPRFLNRTVCHALMRRSIYRRFRELQADAMRRIFVGPDSKGRIE